MSKRNAALRERSAGPLGPSATPSVDGCAATRELLARIGDKWSIYLVGALREGPLRFSALERSIDGISKRMLTLTLKSLERDGLVTRTVTASVPPRVDYALTPLGESLLAPVGLLARWASENGGAVQAARARYDRRAKRAHP